MTEMTRQEGLRNIILMHEEIYENDVVMLLRGKCQGKGVTLLSLATHIKAKAIYSYFVENDLKKSKQYFHLSAKLALASFGENEGASFGSGRWFLTALFSDNKNLIDEYAFLRNYDFIQEHENPASSLFYVHLIQLAILGNDEGVEKKIAIFEKQKNNRMKNVSDLGFYSLLINRDKFSLEKLISGKHANIKSADPVDEDFLSYIGALETKLCWMRGLNVEIDHNLVPMGLMPIRPLGQYDDVYDFLKPEWLPPKQGMLADAVRWIRGEIGI
ncbi:hypothetical protein [Pseudoduganella violacea]|uniref:Uncharacterized protein n=1 Tax=Pseudoduganella violacea TaxID=1715466 RepID=A0A7W5FVX1_9BURK|nr:hypothetical protein [Pseudoduganella violacea]MBB3121282.1 hypothetical protein [Pseudoduganella violacea]